MAEHHHYTTGQEILGADHVTLSDGTHATVITPAAHRSLVEFRNTAAHCDERDWFDNDSLTLVSQPKAQ